MITLDNLIEDGDLLLENNSELNEQKYIEWVYRINSYYIKTEDDISKGLLHKNFTSAISHFVNEDYDYNKRKLYMKNHYFNLLACLKSIKLMLDNK